MQTYISGNLDVRYWNVLMGKHFRLVPEDSEQVRYMASIHIHPGYKGLNDTRVRNKLFSSIKHNKNFIIYYFFAQISYFFLFSVLSFYVISEN